LQYYYFFGIVSQKVGFFSTQVKTNFKQALHFLFTEGVKKNAGFSCFFAEEALAVTNQSIPAIIPGDPHGSE